YLRAPAAGGHLRVHERRNDLEDANRSPLELIAEGRAERAEARLGRAVDGRGALRDQGERRGDIHDVRLGAIEEVRHRERGEQNRTREVRVELRPGLLARDRL